MSSSNAKGVPDVGVGIIIEQEYAPDRAATRVKVVDPMFDIGATAEVYIPDSCGGDTQAATIDKSGGQVGKRIFYTSVVNEEGLAVVTAYQIGDPPKHTVN